MSGVSSNRDREKGLRIGEVAARSGLSVDGVRYYERLGLVSALARTPGGYRLYDARVVERLDFIKRAQRFGFTLKEIKQMVDLERADPHTCAQVLRMLEQKLEDLDRRYAEIRRLRRELSAYRRACQRALAGRQRCPVLEDLISAGRRKS
jgi:DNA-binding transcriptional MerR regulator